MNRRDFLRTSLGAGVVLLAGSGCQTAARRGTRNVPKDLDPMAVKDRLLDAIHKSQADYTEVRYEHLDSTSIICRGKQIDKVAAGKSRGGIVRACTRGGWGTATFDNLDDLPASIAEAAESAALVGREKTRLAAISPIQRMVPTCLQRDFRGVRFDDKLALASRYNDILFKIDPAVQSTSVYYSDNFRTVHFASSLGTYYCEDRPRVILSWTAFARDGSLVQQAGDGISSAITYDAMLGLEPRMEQAGKQAVALLKAPRCPGGRHTVVLDPTLAGVFGHEAFGHLSEADFLYENAKMRDLMTLGRPMGVKALNIYDDGSMPGLIGSQMLDDEGTPMGRTWLIKEGVLAGHLHSRETAARMGEKPTGNARAINRHFSPIVRMTNTCIAPGDQSFERLLAGVDDGIYACSFYGGQTALEMFTFSAKYAYRIEHGKIGELLRDVTLTGNVFETLKAIDGFGSDFRVLQMSGGCGKNGQSPLPVTCNAPHLRIRDVVIGGK